MTFWPARAAFAALLVAFALALTPALAQAPDRPAPGPGMMGPGSGLGPGPGMGPGIGAGPGPRGDQGPGGGFGPGFDGPGYGGPGFGMGPGYGMGPWMMGPGGQGMMGPGFGPGPRGGSGDGWRGPGPAAIFVMPFVLLLALIGLVAVIVWLVRALGGRRGAHAHLHAAGASYGRALEILAERYARGEIGKEEFEEKRRAIGA